MVLFLLSLTGCLWDHKSPPANNPSTSTDLYKGDPLHLAVIGDIPDVRGDKIFFEEISLENLIALKEGSYDGIFIKNKHLSQASKKKYRNMYEKLHIPIFFIESKAYTLPFINMHNQIPYEEYADRINDNQTFISGLWYPENDNEYRTYRFNYPIKDSNYTKNNVNKIYSYVFKTIEDIKNNKEKNSK